MNVLIPMAGDGTRLSQYYDIPKPIIDIDGMPMFSYALQSFNKDFNFFFVVRSEHDINYNISKVIKNYCKDSNVIIQNHKLSGAALSCLLSKDFLYSYTPLAVCDSDIFLQFNINKAIDLINDDADIVVVTADQHDPSYSYVKQDNGNIFDVAEKNTISNDAIAGVTVWKTGRLFFDYILKMIDNNILINNEFYISPSIKLAIEDGKIVKSLKSERFYHLGDFNGIKKFKESKDAVSF